MVARNKKVVTTSRFTHGPWKVSRHDELIVTDERGEYVAGMHTSPWITDEEAAANAVLISQAPQLYAAALKLVRAYQGHAWDGPAKKEINDAVLSAKDVLAAAATTRREG